MNKSQANMFILSPKNIKKINPYQSKYIENLMDSNTTKLFGEIDSIAEIISTRFLTVAINDDHNHIVAAMTFHNSPNIPVVPSWAWDRWFHNLYEYPALTSQNTFWVHLAVFDDQYEMFFARPILQHIFKFFKYVEFIAMVVPPFANDMTNFLTKFSDEVKPKDYSNQEERFQIIRVVSRENFMARYKIRKAVEEDNDDLVPLIDAYSTRLVDLYGHYYIAELLTKHKDCGRQIIVAEYDGMAVAVMILNQAVNYDMLNHEFELVPFNGLKKPSADDYIDFEVASQMDVLLSMTDITGPSYPDPGVDMESLPKTSSASTITKDERSTKSDSHSLILTSSDIFVIEDEVEPTIVTSGTNIEPIKASYEILKEIEQMKKQDIDPRLTYVDITEKSYKMSMSETKNRTEFYGEGNAFCVEVAACHPNHEYSLSLLLGSVFECFPDLDYCIMSVPSDDRDELWMTEFTRVVPSPVSTYPFELYVLHKSALLGCLECQVLRKEHMPEIRVLLSTIRARTALIAQIEICLECPNSVYQCFVFLCEDHVIGTAVVSEEHNIHYIDAQYDIHHWVTMGHFKTGTFGVIENFILSPIFHRSAKFFKRELHRMSDFQVLFYKYKSKDQNTYKERPLPNLIQWFVPILPRWIPDYDYKLLKDEGYDISENVIRKESYALYLSTIAQSSMEHVSINTKIVVVGSSHTAYAFLESLLLSTRNPNFMVTFNNVTQITLSTSCIKIPKQMKDIFVVQKNFYTESYVEMINLQTYINSISGNVTNINRKERYITINDCTSLKYDLLFLMCGEMFAKPLKNYCQPFAEKPKNIFIINSANDANRALIKLKELQESEKKDEPIIFYGHYLQTYACIAGLLEYGVNGTKIILVEPFPYSMNIDKIRRQNISVFNDPDIYNATMEHIEAAGIRVYQSFYFVNWLYNEETQMLDSVTFESKYKMMELACQAVFFFYEKSISPKFYHVINKAGLVYDGRLVIDNNCKTNDERIYAAGTLTKYSRKYFASNMIHRYYNRMEIGARLGAQIRNMIVPGFVKRCDQKQHRWNLNFNIKDTLVPKYEDPIMRYCRLPGNLYYLAIVKPGKCIPLEIASSMENYGQVFITGSCRNLDQQGFFKLHFNEDNRVETITCLTKFPLDLRNLWCLWGKHDKLLNNVQLRYEMNTINDFFQYFKQPWVYALYHDRFEQLMDDLNCLVTSSVDDDTQPSLIITDIIEMYEQQNWHKLTADQRQELKSQFSALKFSQIIEEKVLDFIKNNSNYLPMYAHPLMVRNVLKSFDQSPLFEKYLYK